MKVITFILACFLTLSTAFSQEKPMVCFGVFADCQSAQNERGGTRRYTLSPTKLTQAIDTFNVRGVRFVVSLGDFVDHDIASVEQLVPILDRSTKKIYHILGNHDLLPKPQQRLFQVMQIEAPYYYSRVENGVKFLFLNSNRVDSLQLSWVASELDGAKKAGQIVVVFSHHPLYNLMDMGSAKNSKPLRDLMEQSGVVKASLGGHLHISTQYEINGIYHITLKGMVETDNNRFAIVKIYPHSIEIEGFGDEQDKKLKFIQQ